MTPVNTNKKKVGKRMLGLIFGLSGFAIAVVWFDNVLIRTAGIVICMTGTYLIITSKRPTSMALRDSEAVASSTSTLSRPIWIIEAVSLGITGICSAFLYKDAKDGYHEVWPVYAFAVSMAILALVSSYVVGLLVKKIFTR